MNTQINKITGLLGFVISSESIEMDFDGYSSKLRIEGVGNKVIKDNDKSLRFSLGNSQLIPFRVPSSVKIDILNNLGTLIEVKGLIKEDVTNIVAQLKRLKKRSPYHLKGIYEQDEKIKLKTKKK